MGKSYRRAASVSSVKRVNLTKARQVNHRITDLYLENGDDMDIPDFEYEEVVRPLGRQEKDKGGWRRPPDKRDFGE